MAQQGKIISWNQQKGFGFIAPDNGEQDVFFHVSALPDKQCRPRINEAITFCIGKDKKRAYVSNNGDIYQSTFRFRQIHRAFFKSTVV